VGRTINEVLPDVAPGIEEELRQVIRTGTPIEGGLAKGQTPAQPQVTRTFEHNFYPVKSADGTVVGVSCSVHDVTERKASKKALAAANRELESFADSLAHDLKTPLLTVTNFSYHLQESLADSLDDEQEDHLQRVHGAGQQMVRIIDGLRDLTDVNRVETNQDEVDLTLLAREIIDDLSALTPDRDVTFLAEPGIKAVGEETLLRILLANLLENAWKYTLPNEDARIELGVVENEGHLPVYYVRDNGIGFDNADAQQIFRAFEQLGNGETFAGSGLGLATVERIVRRHGGRVWAEGTPGGGGGAVFRFTLAAEGTEDLVVEQGA